jgi:helix-hairpin-helix protein
MPHHSDHKVLLFLAAVAVLGTGVRVARAARGQGEHGPSAQPALEHQRSVTALSAQRASGRGRATPHMKAAADSDTTRRSPRDSTRKRNRIVAPLDRPGYVAGKLDLDVATAAQLDSLPGVSPMLARRIVADRLERGPFLNADGLRRVSGVGAAFVRKIDTLVTFSGTIKFPDPGDTAIARRKRRVRKRPAG